jgi:hypothetical protein
MNECSTRPNVLIAHDASVLCSSLLRCRLGCRDLLVERQDMRKRAKWCDAVWVDLLVALCVVALDVRELGCASESIHVPVEVPYPSEDSQVRSCSDHQRNHLLVKRWVATPNVTDVALEVLNVDCTQIQQQLDRLVQWLSLPGSKRIMVYIRIS